MGFLEFLKSLFSPTPVAEVKPPITGGGMSGGGGASATFSAPSELPKIVVEGARNWRGIVLHHSATVDGVVNDWTGIKKFHTSWRYNGDIITEAKGKELMDKGVKGVLSPWVDIGYHFGIEKVGENINFQVGRSLTTIGAHAVDFNSSHIGICIIGSFDKVAPDALHWSAAQRLVKRLTSLFPQAANSILGHRETFPLRKVPVEKTCPGTMFDLDAFRKQLSGA